ncbi:hypothetical protein HOC54_02375 [Candidatus Peregrinibacteria bacterium]|nr:hypothetical protein [Candidatus Peregrinibacteria bacterium]
MIIHNIELTDFLCYSGNNSFTFTEGINVIIGDNGYGKSKLYDAFYWVMYDQIFVSERREFVHTRNVKSKLISDKAKAIAEEGKIKASVCITFHNPVNDASYILKRSYAIQKKSGEFIEDNDSKFSIMKKELSYLNAKMVIEDDKKRRLVDRILPPKKKDYLWFQGEQVESIIDFNKQDTLTRAINVLSNISQYDELVEVSEAAAFTAKREYEAEVRRNSKDSGRSNSLSEQKKRLDSKLIDLKNEELRIKEDLSRAEEKCEELLNKQADAQEIAKLGERKKGQVKLLEQYSNQLNSEQINFHKKMFLNKWVLKGSDDINQKYSKLFSEYEQRKMQEEYDKSKSLEKTREVEQLLQARLPFNVPEPNYLEWMLEKQRCLVCDREAEVDSEAWLKIRELLDRTIPEKGDNSETPVNNFHDDYKKLYQNGLVMSSVIKNIDNDIKGTLTKRVKLMSEVKKEKGKVEETQQQILRLLADSSLTTDGAKDILNEYTIKQKYAENYRRDLQENQADITKCESEISSITKTLSELVTGRIPDWLVNKKKTLVDFEVIAKSTQARVFEELITQLEDEANKHYAAMTAGNKSVRGKIKLKKLSNGNYMPEIIDSHGNTLRGSNTSNLIIVKLAAIMAIISASGDANVYPLITDAPTSVFGENYTIGFCKTVSKLYKQSIIMSKEFYRNEKLRNELLTTPEIKIGKVYMISPSIMEGERENRDNLSTNIEALN